MRRLIVLALAAAAVLSGCAPTVALDPAENASDAGCAEVVVRLPDTVPGREGDLERVQTDSQGTGSWGTPSSVLLRCGVPVPDPTSTLVCVSAGNVDWLVDDSNAPTLVYTSYGRDPATEVIVNQDDAAGGLVLLELENAIVFTEQTGKCLDVDDTL